MASSKQPLHVTRPCSPGAPVHRRYSYRDLPGEQALMRKILGKRQGMGQLIGSVQALHSNNKNISMLLTLCVTQIQNTGQLKLEEPGKWLAIFQLYLVTLYTWRIYYFLRLRSIKDLFETQFCCGTLIQSLYRYCTSCLNLWSWLPAGQEEKACAPRCSFKYFPPCCLPCFVFQHGVSITVFFRALECYLDST